MSNWQLSDPPSRPQSVSGSEVCVPGWRESSRPSLCPLFWLPQPLVQAHPSCHGAWETSGCHLVSSRPASVPAPPPSPTIPPSHLGRFSDQQSFPEQGPRTGACERGGGLEDSGREMQVSRGVWERGREDQINREKVNMPDLAVRWVCICDNEQEGVGKKVKA